MTATVLNHAGLDPTVVVGGRVGTMGGSNARVGHSDFLVAEADESDGSFLYLKPFYSVITNIEMEHVDYYNTLEDCIASYAAFANNTKAAGTLFYNYDDRNIKKMLKSFTMY